MRAIIYPHKVRARRQRPYETMEVAEKFGRSGTSEADLLDQAVLEGRLGRRPLLRDFQTWDATTDLAQATWEWPKRWTPLTAIELLVRRDGF